MGEVVVAEDRASRRAEWRMPAIIEAWFSASEKMIAARQHGAERRERGLVGDVARGEDQRRFLAVEVGELALEQHVAVVGAGDVARAAGAGAACASIAACMASITTGCWPMPR